MNIKLSFAIERWQGGFLQ